MIIIAPPLDLDALDFQPLQTPRAAMRQASRLAVAATMVPAEEADEMFRLAGKSLAVAWLLSGNKTAVSLH